MDRILELQGRYAAYRDQVAALQRSAPPFAGLFGLGSGPKDDPCHRRFLSEIAQCTEAWAQEEMEPDEAAAVVGFILQVQTQDEPRGLCYWTAMAAHSACLALIPKLEAQDASALAARYAHDVKRRERMPLQERVLAALRAQAASLAD